MILLILKILLTAVLTIAGVVRVSERIMGYGNWLDTLVLQVVFGIILYVTWF